MTEPDLVTIEDGATVDDASLIGHLNSRGVFTLNRLHVGKGAGMRSFTRLLSGATMEASSRMLARRLTTCRTLATITCMRNVPCTFEIVLEKCINFMKINCRGGDNLWA